MTRVAIIGNSHLTAFYEATEQILALYPTVELFFFGLDNHVFFKADQLKGKALRVAEPPERNRRQVINPKAAHRLNFDDFDLVLLTSHGFYLRHLFGALGSFNVLGLRALDDTGPVVSHACLQDAMATHINTYTSRLRRFLPRADNAVVVQMPYPSIDAAGMSDALAGLQAQPDRAALFEMFNMQIQDQMFAKGLGYFPVPEPFLDSPFFTKAEHARKVAMAADAEIALTDYMHMNAGYACGVFENVHAALMSA